MLRRRRGHRPRARLRPGGRGRRLRSSRGHRPRRWRIGLQASYWVQMITVFSFLVLLPLGEHFHIVTALPARVPRARDAAEPGALRRPRGDHGRRRGRRHEGGREDRAPTSCGRTAFDAFTCTECGRCKDSCPTFLTGKPLAHEVGERFPQAPPARAARGDRRGPGEADLPALVAEVIKEETLWACTTCGYCERACPIGLEHLGRFYRLRQHQVMMEGAFPQELKAVFDAYESQSQPVGAAGGHARRLGEGAGRAGARKRGAGEATSTGSSTWARRSRSTPRAEDGQGVRADPEAAGVRFAILGRARGLHRRVRAPRRQRDALPVARPGAGGDAERARREAHRHLRPARVQLAQATSIRSSAGTSRWCTTRSSSTS